MIGLRIAPRVGPFAGLACGVGADELGGGDPMAGVTKDLLLGKYFPANAAEWTTAMGAAGLATGNPSAVWNFQDPSGNPVDAVGTFTLTASGTGLAYQQAVAGCSRLALTTTDGSSGKLLNTDAGLPDISATSILLLSVLNLPASFGATQRSIATVGPTFATQVAAQTNPSSNPAVLGLAQKGGSQGGGFLAAAATPTTGVHPVIVQMNVTSELPFMYTDADKTTDTRRALQTGKAVCFGGDNGNFWFGASVGYLYAAAFFGTAGELTDVQIRSLLKTLGWTVAW